MEVNDSANIQHKQQVRGGRTVEWLQEDVDALGLERFLCLNTGVQEYLNRVFAADGAVTKYSERLQFIGRNNTSVACDDTLGIYGKNAFGGTSRSYLGDACVILLATYIQYVQYDTDVWDDWNMGTLSRI